MTLPIPLAAPMHTVMMFWAIPCHYAIVSQRGHTSCGHESLYDAKVVPAMVGRVPRVCGTGGIADNLEEVIRLLMVQLHHKHGGIRRRRDSNVFGSALQVNPSLLHGSEDTSGLFPLMTNFPFSPLTVPLNLPWMDSYWSM